MLQRSDSGKVKRKALMRPKEGPFIPDAWYTALRE